MNDFLAKVHVISGFIEKIIVGVFQNPFFQNSGLVSMSPIWGGIQKKVSKGKLRIHWKSKRIILSLN